MVSALGLDGCVDFLLIGLLFDDVGLLNASDMQYVWSAGEAVDESRCRACVQGRMLEGFGEGWVLGRGTGTSYTAVGLTRSPSHTTPDTMS